MTVPGELECLEICRLLELELGGHHHHRDHHHEHDEHHHLAELDPEMRAELADALLFDILTRED